MIVLNDIEQYDQESPERRLIEWFEALGARRYGRAVSCCCHAVRGPEGQPVFVRREKARLMEYSVRGIRYDELEVLDTEYRQSVNPEQPGTALAIVLFRYRYSMQGLKGQGKDMGEAQATIRIVRENQYGVAMTGPPATWGVIPYSMRPITTEEG